MPTLEWIGKEKVVSHHRDVPFRVLEHQYGFSAEKGETKEPTGSGNMIIHGDNLEALKALLPEYEGRIKCIYIDPPYNTGEEKWAYNDNVNHPKIKKWLGEVVGKEGDDLSRHDKWLCMMYPRLKLLQRLLSDTGAIFISLDENEIVHARLMCNEIFGKDKFVAQISLLCNPKGRSQDKYFATNHEYCLVYSKKVLPSGAFEVEKDNEQVLKDYKLKDNDGRYRLLELRNTHREFNRENRPNLFYPIYVNPLDYTVSLTKSEEHHIECLPVWNDGYEGCWTWGTDLAEKDIHLLEGHKKKSGWKIYRKSYAEVGDSKASKKLFTILQNRNFYTEKGQNTFGEIFPGLNKNDFPQPKSVDFIKELISTISDDDSIILDSFAGSGTTGHAVLKLNKEDGGNRKFILVEMEDYANPITSERLKKVIAGYEYVGIEKETISVHKINLTTLKKAEKIIEKYEEIKNSPSYKDAKIESYNSTIEIIGSKEVNGKTEGLGNVFDFFILGKPLFIGENQEFLNEEVGIEEIRKYIWYSETRTSLFDKKLNQDDNIYLLGSAENSSYYFYYEQDHITTLDHDFLATIKSKSEQYIIYADNCLLSKDFMAKNNIIFKKIPRDITRF